MSDKDIQSQQTPDDALPEVRALFIQRYALQQQPGSGQQISLGIDNQGYDRAAGRADFPMTSLGRDTASLTPISLRKGSRDIRSTLTASVL